MARSPQEMMQLASQNLERQSHDKLSTHFSKTKLSEQHVRDTEILYGLARLKFCMEYQCRTPQIYLRGIAEDDHICHPEMSTVIPIKTATPDAKAFKLVVSQRFLFLIALDVAPAKPESCEDHRCFYIALYHSPGKLFHEVKAKSVASVR